MRTRNYIPPSAGSSSKTTTSEPSTTSSRTTPSGTPWLSSGPTSLAFRKLLSDAERKGTTLRAGAVVEQPDLPPNAPGERIARILGYQVKLTDRLPPNVDGTWRKPSEAQPYNEIYLARRITLQRRSFTAAHELLHALAPADLVGGDLEAWCNRGAAAVLMPREPFLHSGVACGWNLRVLTGWWPYCAPLALLRRMTDLLPRLRVSAWVKEQMAASASSLVAELPGHVQELEAAVAAEAMEVGQSQLEDRGMVLRGWRNGHARAVVLLHAAA